MWKKELEIDDDQETIKLEMIKNPQCYINQRIPIAQEEESMEWEMSPESDESSNDSPTRR